MAYRSWIVAFGFIAAAAPLSALTLGQASDRPAPTDRADTRYCLRVAPLTGSLSETVQCWTRAQWVEQGVDIDKEWDKDGVAVRR